MASRVDSLQDIFGPSEPSGAEAVETAPAVASSSATITNLDEFDDIFASSTDDAPAPAAPSGDAVAHELKTRDTTPVPASSGSTDVSPSTDDFDDIFGNAPPATAEGLLPSSSEEQTGVKSDPAGGTSEGSSSEAAQQRSDTKAMGTADPGPSPAPVAGGSTGGDDSEFLNFLYDDDKKGKATTTTAVTPQAEEETAASLLPAGGTTTTTTSTTATPAEATAGETFSALGSTPADSSSAPKEKNPSPPSGGPPGASGASSPSSHLDSVPLGSPLAEDTRNASAGSTSAAVTAAAERLEEAVKEGKLDAPSPSPAMPPPPPPPPPPSSEMCFVRKEKVEVLPPLPEDPASALRQLALPETATSAAAEAEPEAEGGGEAGAVSMASREGGSDGRGPAAAAAAAAASDVGYVRRLCAATGGFLPPDLRAVVWGLLLGLGRKPEDKGFVKWREARRRDGAATVAYMLDLKNDCLALARRLCDDSGGGGGGREGGGGAGVKGDPEALAVDIEEVLAFYCSRRSEAYEPVLCALVGPLFSMGLDPSAVSAMLYPLVGSLTLFLGRGLTHTVRDLAWVHAHRRVHDLCTYHDPELVQHLNRCFPGWEMPLPAASVSRAETSALDQEAAAIVDDLESSLPPSLQMRRLSVGSPASAHAATASTTTAAAAAAAVDGTEAGERPGPGQGQGVVEPSLLVAANAGLGASAPLGCLLPLWDYLLIRHDKHFGFFLLIAALLRRRDELLAATGQHLRLLLAETLSPAKMATVLTCEDGKGDGNKEGMVSKSPLVLWCEEAEALDLATPESFRHHLGLIGEIAEAEHEAIVRARARKGVDAGGAGEASVAAPLPVVPASGGGAHAAGPAEGAGEPKADAPGQAEADPSAAAKGLSHPSLLRVRSMMRNAGDKLAADLKHLKLARTGSGPLENPDSLAAPIELSLPQLCLAVSAKEVVSGVSSRGRGLSERGETANKDKGEPAAAAGSGAGGGGGRGEGGGGELLFRQRQPLFFFVVDCRPKAQVDAGRFPTAFHLDPSSMDNPEEMAESIMPVFEPLRRRAHVCLVGSGDGHMRARGLGTKNGRGMGSQKAARDEYSYVNTCALFFMKRGFPYVSVLEGGFAAAHELVMDTADRAGAVAGAGGDGSGGATSTSTVIVDHDVTACRLCLAQKPGGSINNAPPGAGAGVGGVGGGGGGGAAGVASGVASVAGGLLFPLSPPLWARIGAADSSGHGSDKGQAQGKGTDKASPFFSPKLPLGSGSGGASGGGASGADATKGVASGQGGGGGGGGGEGNGVPGGATAGGDSGSGGNVFRAGGMFRGMNMNMNMNMNMAIFKGGQGPGEKEGGAAGGGATSLTAASSSGGGGSSAPVANGAADTERGENAGDLASKFRISFARFGGGPKDKDVKNDDAEGRGGGVGVGAAAAAAATVAAAGGAAVADKSPQPKDSGFGSLFRKAQAFKAADVAAAFAELRDGPKVSGAVGTGTTAVSTPIGGVSDNPGQVVEVQEILGDDDEEDDDAGGLFVIGDDGSEASETPDSDFEGFDGEHRPHSTGGARSTADKELALLEHRLSGQIKGATMVVDDFLKVPGAKVFSVTKHKVTYHDVDPTPGPASDNASEEKPLSETPAEGETAGAIAAAATDGDDKEDSPLTKKEDGVPGDVEASGMDSSAQKAAEPKRLRVRAVTELERVVFLSRERILVLACPGGFGSPGLVKSNHHLTELQKMTFMRRDPTLVTLHYLAHENGGPGGVGGGGGAGTAVAAVAQGAPAVTKRNVYRFEIEDKEAFIRIIRSALQRFQA